MPKIDLTISISVIVALSAIISPILTSIIDNHYRLKMKRLELHQQEYEQTVLHKRDVFENYLRYLNDVYQNPSSESLSNYSQYYPLACLYLPADTANKLSAVNHALANSIHTDIIDDIDEIIIAVTAELRRL